MNVVLEDNISAEKFSDEKLYVKILFVPIVSHYSLAFFKGTPLMFIEMARLEIIFRD
jgi:hypothetical protein